MNEAGLKIFCEDLEVIKTLQIIDLFIANDSPSQPCLNKEQRAKYIDYLMKNLPSLKKVLID